MDQSAARVLTLGGARSGKSRFAQELVERSGLDPLFIATAQAFDDEMASRIRLHIEARDARRWRTLDAPYDLAGTLASAATPGTAVLVDCLTLWLSNLMLRGDNPAPATEQLAALLPQLPGAVVLVSNEVGSGIVPDYPLGRAFRDAQGRLNRMVAAACTTVVLVTAGLPLVLKPAPAPAIRL